nr:MAG TPA: hypothetical protein [Bacteriophage sp.]
MIRLLLVWLVMVRVLKQYKKRPARPLVVAAVMKWSAH